VTNETTKLTPKRGASAGEGAVTEDRVVAAFHVSTCSFRVFLLKIVALFKREEGSALTLLVAKSLTVVVVIVGAHGVRIEAAVAPAVLVMKIEATIMRPSASEFAGREGEEALLLREEKTHADDAAEKGAGRELASGHEKLRSERSKSCAHDDLGVGLSDDGEH
jgi:hypothetical protein